MWGRRRFVHVRRNPPGLVSHRHTKTHSLTGRITLALLAASFKAVKRNRGAAGIDRVSAEKTRITTYGKGYTFLGFVMSSRSRRMRPKSGQKFQDHIRTLTVRSHNLDAHLIAKLNRLIQGTAHYFTPRWSTSRWVLHRLDSWIRRRWRCLKFKRFSYQDNHRMRLKQFDRLGLLGLESFCPC